MDYPLEESKEPSTEYIFKVGDEFDIYWYRFGISKNSVMTIGCTVDVWEELFYRTLAYAVENSKKYMIFVWSKDEEIKVKTSRFEEFNKVKKTKIDNKYGGYEMYPNAPGRIVGIPYRKNIEPVEDKKTFVFMKKYKKNVDLSAFKGVVFNRDNPVSSEEELEVFKDMDVGTEIVINFEYERMCIENIAIMLEYFEGKNVSFLLDTTIMKSDPYVLLTELIKSGIKVGLVFVPSMSNYMIRETIKVCIKEKIPYMIKLTVENIINRKDCYCYIFRNVVDENLCERIFDKLLRKCTKRYAITVFNREGITPRTQLLYADDIIKEMNYSTVKIPAKPWTEDMSILRDFCKDLIHYTHISSFKPNSCLINGYIEETDMVGAHRDKGLKDGNDIVCTVSLGGTRRFVFRDHKTKAIEADVLLNEGDVVFMCGDTNKEFTHEIPKYRKTMDKWEFKERFSATFREI